MQHWICGAVQVAAWNNRTIVCNPAEHAALVAVAEAAEATLAPYPQAIYGKLSVSAHKLSVALAALAAVRGQK